MLERISVMGKKSLSATAQSFERRVDARVQGVVTCHNSVRRIMSRDVSSLPMFLLDATARGGEGEPLNVRLVFCPFLRNPLPLVKDLLALRRKSNTFKRSHLGLIVNGECLSPQEVRTGRNCYGTETHRSKILEVVHLTPLVLLL